MIATRRVIGAGLVIAAAVPALYVQAVSSSGAFSTRYEIIDLGTLGGGSSVGIRLNDLGHVVGSADTSEGVRHAYLWRNGVMTDLGTLGSISQSEAWGVNNNGQVVGRASGGGGHGRAFIWEDGVMSELGDPAFPKSAYGINDAGQAVGTFIAPPKGNLHAFLWEDGVMTDLTVLGFGSGIAWDINENGDVVGGCCLWDDGVVVDLGSLGGEFAGAVGINDLQQIVGGSQREGDDLFQAYIWENGQMTDLGAILDVSSSRSNAINNKGQVIGVWYIYDPDEGFCAIADLIPPDSGWSNMFARDINDKSQICGVGTINGLRHAFLMNPLPPIPTTSQYGAVALGVVLLPAGIILIARRQRRLPTNRASGRS